MKTVIHRPDASAIFSSLRAIGYSFNTALADIIDNSLAAAASHIDVGFRSEPEPYVAILDDGRGMTPDVLIQAMRHGGNGPREARRADDLGRYGLGLKTASLSQCRRLSVVTLIAERLSAARWDLDHVEDANEWTLEVLDDDEIQALPRVHELIAVGHGTIVLWEHFDRATAGERAPGEALGRLVDDSRSHLSLVFHRYIAPDGHESACRVSINSLDLVPNDPFLRSNPFTETLPSESIVIENALVTIQPYILPHLSNISVVEMQQAGGIDLLRQTQGFYIYRNRRLITFGTWFRLVRQHELTKLARVRIDIPNSLDHLWGLDVKKSTANPPEAVRSILRRITDRIADRGANVFRERRRRARYDDTVHIWDRVKVRGSTVYTINLEHPLVAAAFSDLPASNTRRLDEALEAIEIALPADAIFADMASDESVERPPDDLTERLTGLAHSLFDQAGNEPAARARTLALLPTLDPFSMYPTQTREIVEALRNARS
jgi:hypothetical protein